MAEQEVLTTTEQAGAAPAEARPPVVALVCPADGLDAVQRVLRPLPATFPAALIVLLQQPLDRVSHLTEILARNSCFPVRTARHGEPLVAGTVYVAPPGHHAVVTTANTIGLVATDHTPPYHPSADLLLTSLALTAADRSIVVVLSGWGHDGATGATALHDFGGIVVASDRDSSIPVDYVVALDDIPALLLTLVTR